MSVLASMAALAVAAGAPAPAVLVDRAGSFAARGGPTLRMDVFRPAPRGDRAPAIVWVHGGGFHSGGRARMAPHAAFFAREGYVAATIDYRLQPHAEVRRHGYAVGEPAARADALAAVGHLRRNAGALGLDPARIVVAGASAGAVTALNLATQGPGTAPVAAAISLAGYGHPEDVGPGDAPLLLVHGDADRAIPFARAHAMCDAAAAAGVRCDLVSVPGAGHRTLLGRPLANARRAAAWLRRLAL